MDKLKAQQLQAQGKSYRTIAKELSCSKSTVANALKGNKTKFAFNPNDPSIVPTNADWRLNTTHVLNQLPPGAGNVIVPSAMQYSGLYQAGAGFYLPADLAIRDNRYNARSMWNDLVIRTALQDRLWSAAEQEWHIESADPKDESQQAIAEDIQATIENIPDFLKMKYSLLKSRWFGVYGVNLVYRWNARKKLEVEKWIELHGDSLLFREFSDEIAVYVTTGTVLGAKHVTSVAGWIGRAHIFQDNNQVLFDREGKAFQALGTNEREAVIICRYDPQASDFLDPRAAAGTQGLGIRSTCYPVWYMKTEVVGNLMDWLERVGTGITLCKFQRGNDESYNQAVELGKSQSNQNVVMVPIDPDLNGGKPMEGIERIEVPATGLDNMLKVADGYFGKQLRQFIVGQDSTSQEVNTGLGSKISEVQQNTFYRIVKFDCVDLAQCLTRELVRVIQKYNHPGTPPCKFVIDMEHPDNKEKLETVKIAYELGVEFNADEIRSLTGLSKPQVGDEIIKKSSDAPNPFDPTGANANPFGGNSDDVEEEDKNESEDEDTSAADRAKALILPA